jgi:hypothetical protein
MAMTSFPVAHDLGELAGSSEAGSGSLPARVRARPVLVGLPYVEEERPESPRRDESPHFLDGSWGDREQARARTCTRKPHPEA